jgi:hypothetical protein
MALESIVERFTKRSPVTVMVRWILQHAMNSRWIDQLFEAQREKQYPRELLFSTVVDLMALAYRRDRGPVEGEGRNRGVEEGCYRVRRASACGSCPSRSTSCCRRRRAEGDRRTRCRAAWMLETAAILM